ncbi:MAG: (2Fe-2S)-binding protein [Candidatus Sericytochromatia bacterium]|nr:(2Fe-2S)-binding protein [Candidatus Tanganyikabacteria bacterium]
MKTLLVDDTPIDIAPGTTVLQACWAAGAYVPALCAHPALPTTGHCGMCLVEVDGEVALSCDIAAAPGMAVTTTGERLETLRRKALSALLANHPHECLTCPEREGCDRVSCSMGVDMAERCCERFGECEVQQVAECVGIPSSTPRFRPRGLPAFQRDTALHLYLDRCIACMRCVDACVSVKGHGALTWLELVEGIFVGPSAGASFKEAGCKFCGACIEVCPAGSMLEQGPRGRRWRDLSREKLAFPPMPLPPRRHLALAADAVATVPAAPGAFRLFDAAGRVHLIEGVDNLREALGAHAASGVATHFDFHEAQMYSQRANELLQAHLKEHGKLPPGNDLDDDLF